MDVPDPVEAADLRAEFAGNLLVERAVAALRSWHTVSAQHAVALLSAWEHYGELTERERRAVIARWVPPPDHGAGSSGPGWPFGGRR